MLSDIDLLGTEYGGTCSDKVLHFQKVLSANGIHAQLHSAWINDHRCHRLLTTEIDSQKYFIDVGSGWPILQLIPAFKSIRFSVFGMTFETVQSDEEIHLFHKTKDEFKLMVRIPIESQSESQIIDEINNRFIDKSIYPFEKSIRFSKIADESFVFLKGNRLRTFGSRDFQEQILSEAEILNFLAHQMSLNDTPAKLRNALRSSIAKLH